MILVPSIGLPLVIAPVNSRVVIINVVPNLSVDCFDAARVDELGELLIGNFGPVDEKVADVNLLLRPLILRSVVTSHGKHTGGNADQIRRTL
jgi:hypothetical protein